MSVTDVKSILTSREVVSFHVIPHSPCGGLVQTPHDSSLQDIITDMIANDFIEPVPANTKVDISPTFIYAKKGTTAKRMVHDFRKVNQFVPIPKTSFPSSKKLWPLI